MTELTLEVERIIAAPQETLFKAWLDPDMLRRFMLPGQNMTVPRASADPTVGGRFEIIMQAGDQEMPHAGTYREITPHERIVFTWESAHSTETDSEVTLEFIPQGDSTKVRLSHVRFANEEMRNNHQGGWTAILAALDSAVG
ncbi:SRPBCC family protein [Marinovum sp. 2_MG-2023]|uniref:SRPBCC family protein n=1 Tax=unclassified Marinovum TaxID=2647166 RepID=UPI0026E28082|nr:MULTISPECIES: SRPBCC family protein [unclassified Marinovum]MDO6730866.1 SRPBCC family protein [Marinovum sp. 2_MG-2023]MDO6779929.1 SRPBCC family protein [Marinovum sp. 1_MG-2023]